MTVDDIKVWAHIDRALTIHIGVPDFPRRLTKAFRLIQAERRVPGTALDENLAAADHYLFARQAVAGNAISLTQMLVMASGDDPTRGALQRLACGASRETTARQPLPVSQDCVGWAVAGAMRGETDHETYLPGSRPPPFKPAFMKP